MHTAESTDQIAIRQLLERWAAAVHAQDIDAVLLDHADDILMFDVPGPISTVGIDAYKNSWPQMFASFRGAFIFDLSDVAVAAGTDVAFASALIRCEGIGRSEEPVMLDVRFTAGLRKIRDRWIVTHEHHSVPNP